MNIKQRYEMIESKVIDFHAKLPHLPNTGRQWLADNVWWIVLIAAVVGAVGAAALVLVTMIGGVFLAGAVFLFSAKFGGLALLAVTAAIMLMLANVVISIVAINPLREKMRKGWLLLVASLAVGFVAAILTDIVQLDDWAVIKDGLFLAIGLYVMFEIRDYFTKTPAVPAKAVSSESPTIREG